MRSVALILAAGSGDRLGMGAPKALVPVQGRPMLVHALEGVAESGVVEAAIVVVPGGFRTEFEMLLSQVGARLRIGPLVVGGATRQESVRLGLEAVGNRADVVLCHDAARPLASPGLFRRVAEALAGVQGCVPVVTSPDTVKLVEAGRVIRTIPREQVGLAQTPQAFLLPILVEAHDRARRDGLEGTDDAMLVEALGYDVAVAEGEPQNLKITTADDLLRADQILSERTRIREGLNR